MEKPLELTRAQQRHTLSVKKKKQQQTLKNVLAQPFPRYWPQIDANESKECFSLLNELKSSHPNYFVSKKSDNPRPFTYGLSSVLRRLKGGRVRVVILSADLKPRYVINQIILLALARNVTITILCVPNLEQEMKSLLDFQCFAFAINDSDSSELHKLFEWCQIVTSERHPVPKLIREYFRTRQQTSSAIDSIPMEMDNALAQRSTNVERSLRDLHLIRSSTAPEQRAFIPKNAISFKPLSFDVTSLDKIKSDFISLDAFDSDDSRTINPLQLPPSTSQEGEKRSAKFRPTHVKEAMKGEQRYQSAKIKRYAGKPEKKENDGKVKLSRKEKKELKKAMKTAKKNKQIS